MIPATSNRVQNATDDALNHDIAREAEQRIAWYAAHTDQISQRLWQLDREWDTERVLETNASALALFGVVMAMLRGRHWLLLPMVVTGFLLQHAVQGWCPPLPLIRRLKVRTQREIASERYALKTLRGDFSRKEIQEGDRASRIEEVLRAVSQN